jgi:type II secretory pathway pseudopilin PulG
MGQQQMLLLVLGIVIVGIASVAGMNAYEEGRNKADRNAAATDAMRIVSGVQEWKSKSSANGGGASADGFTGVTFPAVGVSPSSLSGDTYPISTGCLTLTGGTNAILKVYKKDCSTEIATVTISGRTSADITWSYPS